MADKKAATQQKSTSAKMAKGDVYQCEVCGLSVTVDETCGCVETCDIICCSKPMQAKTTRARTSKAAATKK